MKRIILPTEGTVPRVVCAYGYLAIHRSDTEAELYPIGDPFDEAPRSEVPADLPLRALLDLGLIERDEYEARLPGEKRRMAEQDLKRERAYLAAVSARIEEKQAALEAMG